MLSRKQLEEIIKAWPDENGVSSNPEVYDQWIFSQNQYFVDKVYLALGTDRVDRLSEKQLNLLNNALYRLKASKSVFDITLEEIVGQYELVTYLQDPPSWLHTMEVRFFDEKIPSVTAHKFTNSQVYELVDFHGEYHGVKGYECDWEPYIGKI